MTDHKQPITVSPAHAIGLLITVLWGVIILLYFAISKQALAEAFSEPLVGLMSLLAAILPVALIWTAVLTVGTATKLKKEATELRHEMQVMATNMRQTTERMPQEQTKIIEQLKLIAEMTIQNDKRLKSLAADAAPKMDILDLNKTVFGTFQSHEEESQIALPLGGRDAGRELPPMPVSDLISAMNFPDNAKDKDGFRTLRRAMEDRKLSAMLDSAQRVMSMLTEDGIYMDDLSPDRAVSNTWRKFAKGTRGLDVTTVGGVRDKAVLGIARARMKTDADFRERVHYFMRQFDDVLVEYEPRLQNHELTDLANTRSARCFMVMARVSGAFD